MKHLLYPTLLLLALASCTGNSNNATTDKIDSTKEEAIKPKNLVNNHEFVDLGLPSGILWATCNIGTNDTAGLGDLYAWAEVSPKDEYTKKNYKWADYDEELNMVKKVRKYNMDSRFGKVDGLKTIEPEDDAATVNWGSPWRIPTIEEWEEISRNCSWKWVSSKNSPYGYGCIVTGKNGNHIFIPYNYGGPKRHEGYWSSSFEGSQNDGLVMKFDDNCHGLFHDGLDLSPQWMGRPIRAVISK